jgi:hypothetical protein
METREMRMARTAVVLLSFFLAAALCKGAEPSYPDLKSAWESNKGKCGDLRPFGASIFELRLSEDGKGGDCISSVGSDLVIIKSGTGSKAQYIVLPISQLALRVPAA